MRLTSFSTKALVAGVAPMLACSTYYTLEKLENASSVQYLATSLAFPVMLLGCIGLIKSLASGKKTGVFSWVSGIAIVLPTIWLTSIWL